MRTFISHGGRFLLKSSGPKLQSSALDDDAAEASRKIDARDQPRREKQRGQNKARDFGFSRDEKGLCASRQTAPEFSPRECQYGQKCRFEHDLRKYLKDWKREDLQTFDGKCPVFSAKGWCNAGWKCRFVGSHSEERELPDGRKELHLIKVESDGDIKAESQEIGVAVVNSVSSEAKIKLMKKKFPTPLADQYIDWLGSIPKESEATEDSIIKREENRALYREAPLLPSEKRRIYFGPETPVLAPLTTQGNLPFRRLCVGFGAQITYSEMSMGLPLLQGHKPEWALLRAHESETTPPVYDKKGEAIQHYDNTKDLKFGAQIATHQPWVAFKTTEVITQLCPYLRVVDLNSGCPIDLVCRTGAGSALLDRPNHLEKILRGMNTVSGEVPVTVKIRMGTKDAKPTAARLIDRLVYGTEAAQNSNDVTSGVAAITLHGRSKQQRYTKNANWEYIAECAALINRHRDKGNDLMDTVQETDRRYQPAAEKVYFIGNGDCYSHVDYYNHLENAKVDSVMVARGALVKPWIFEEIEKNQYLDKSASERLGYVEQFCRFGLEAWGSDEMGVGVTRRFLLEWLNFTHRYVPLGILEHLPPKIQDRPPPWKGRNDLETLMGSDNYKDWIKIR